MNPAQEDPDEPIPLTYATAPPLPTSSPVVMTYPTSIRLAGFLWLVVGLAQTVGVVFGVLAFGELSATAAGRQPGTHREADPRTQPQPTTRSSRTPPPAPPTSSGLSGGEITPEVDKSSWPQLLTIGAGFGAMTVFAFLITGIQALTGRASSFFAAGVGSIVLGVLWTIAAMIQLSNRAPEALLITSGVATAGALLAGYFAIDGSPKFKLWRWIMKESKKQPARQGGTSNPTEPRPRPDNGKASDPSAERAPTSPPGQS